MTGGRWLDFSGWLRDRLLWIAAVPLALAPTRTWPRLEPHVPVRSAAVASAIATLLAGFFLDVGGFLAYGTARAAARNDQIMEAVHQGLAQKAIVLSDASAALAILTLAEFIFLTPLGLFATYMIASGAARAISAGVGEPHGDPLLSALHWMATTAARRNRRDRARIARERREGRDAPDVLRTGEWAGVDVDYVLLAARRKPEWNAGAIVMTSSDWYRLGTPFDIETPAGIRAAYPLKKLDAVEVVRRGIEYELPRLTNTKAPPGANRAGLSNS